MPSSLVGECLCLAVLSHGPTYCLRDGLTRAARLWISGLFRVVESARQRCLPSMTIPPTIKQITDCLERGVEPCGHLRERGQGVGLLFHQRRQQGDAFLMALDHVTVAAQRRIVQELRPFQERETVLVVGGVHAEVLLVHWRGLAGRWRAAGDSAGSAMLVPFPGDKLGAKHCPNGFCNPDKRPRRRHGPSTLKSSDHRKIICPVIMRQLRRW